MESGFWNRRAADLRQAIGTRRMRLAGMVLLSGRDGPAAALPARTRREVLEGTHRSAAAAMIRDFLQPGDRVLEVGTGPGLTALLAAERTGPGQVVTYEANPALEPLIRANFALNDSAPVLRIAAISADGRDFPVAGHAPTPGLSVDAALAEHRAYALVLDAGGSEVEILTAADLRRVARIILATHPERTGPAAQRALEKTLVDRGFRVRARAGATCLVTR